MISIKKVKTTSKDNLVIVSEKFKNDASFQLSDAQLKYIDKELKNEKKFISIYDLNRHIFILTIDSKKEIPAIQEILRKNGCTVVEALNASKESSVTVCNQTSLAHYSLCVAEGIALGNYQFLTHKTDAKKATNTLSSISIVDERVSEKQLHHLSIAIESNTITRDLVNEPVNVLNAEGLADAFKKLGKKSGLTVSVLTKSKIEQLKMGGLLAVNKGSVDPPTFSIIEYKPKKAKNKQPYVLIGKGVTYDTGGLSLKPTPNSMDMMKCDMAGGATVGATLYAIAKAKLDVYVIGLVPATDNRPGFNAFAPGDVITMMDGSTVEMLNSDAEGRMILADALHYAKRYNPELVIELSTLTGAAAVAIGPFGSVCMGTASPLQKQRLLKSGEQTHERLVEFPLWDEYDDLLKSDIADVKNLGGSFGGAITAGKFLARFTNYPFMHIDIAGPAYLTAKDSYRGKGGTGYGVRLLFDFFANL